MPEPAGPTQQRAVYPSTPDPATARHLVEPLVERRRAASVTIVYSVKPGYHWQEASERHGRWRRLAKTQAAPVEAIVDGVSATRQWLLADARS